jgi:hypothetical protein
MTENTYKENNRETPIEKHDTAAWADIESTKPVSKVTLPSEVQVKNAKEHVDTDQK